MQFQFTQYINYNKNLTHIIDNYCIQSSLKKLNILKPMIIKTNKNFNLSKQ